MTMRGSRTVYGLGTEKFYTVYVYLRKHIQNKSFITVY